MSKKEIWIGDEKLTRRVDDRSVAAGLITGVLRKRGYEVHSGQVAKQIVEDDNRFRYEAQS